MARDVNFERTNTESKSDLPIATNTLPITVDRNFVIEIVKKCQIAQAYKDLNLGALPDNMLSLNEQLSKAYNHPLSADLRGIDLSSEAKDVIWDRLRNNPSMHIEYIDFFNNEYDRVKSYINNPTKENNLVALYERYKEIDFTLQPNKHTLLQLCLRQTSSIIDTKNQIEFSAALGLCSIPVQNQSLCHKGTKDFKEPYPLHTLDLMFANFSGADLRDVNFSNTKLTRANLSDANLEGANLSNVDITSSDLRGAKLANANLTGIEIGNLETLPSQLGTGNNFAIAMGLLEHKAAIVKSNPQMEAAFEELEAAVTNKQLETMLLPHKDKRQLTSVNRCIGNDIFEPNVITVIGRFVTALEKEKTEKRSNGNGLDK